MKEEEYLQEISQLREENRELRSSLKEYTQYNKNSKKEIKQREESNYSLGFFVGIAIAYLYLKCFTDFDIFHGLDFGEIVSKILVEAIKSMGVSFACLVVGTLFKIGIDNFESPYGTTIKKKIFTLLALLAIAFLIAAIITFFKAS